MNDGPLIGAHDVFEGQYSEKFRSLVRPEGEFIHYERDRVAVDLGVHLTVGDAPGRRASHTRIWFQLKGIHRETLSLEEFRQARSIAVRLSVEHLKFWFASPEPIYLATYVEAADTFLIEDVREIVYRQWGDDFLAQRFATAQSEVVVRLSADTLLTRERLQLMRRHQSMRIDGPFFRGRPLGHRLDPLRCCLAPIEPSVYVALVERLLAEHDYRVSELLPAGQLIETCGETDQHAKLSVGRLYATFEWVSQLMTEFGVDPGDDFRHEGVPQFAHGRVAVLIDGSPGSLPSAQRLGDFAQELAGKGVTRFLVFANTDDLRYFGSFAAAFRSTVVKCMPQLLRDLAYSLLTVTVVYLEFRDVVSWDIKNYL